jgi:AraC family transcriptional regulator
VTSRMDQSRSDGDPRVGPQIVSDSLHLENAATLTTSSTCKSGMGFVELKGDRDDVGVSERVRDDAFLVAVQLKECPDFDLYADFRLFPHRNFVAGSVTIYDMRTNLLYDLRPPKAGDLRDTFHAIDFYLPCKALDSLTDDAGSPRIEELRHEPGQPFRDSIVRDLVRSIEPTLAVPPGERIGLFVDHVAMALATHVAHTYGGMRSQPVSTVGRLATWQERRAKELLAANLRGGVTLGELASVCGLSVRHFTRAFRGSTGMSPNAWLQRHRVEKAKGLLTSSNRVLSDVALDCGFADQSHFSRTFQRTAGLSPGGWRRLYRR